MHTVLLRREKPSQSSSPSSADPQVHPPVSSPSASPQVHLQVLKSILKSILKSVTSPSEVRRMKPKSVCLVAIMVGLISMASGRPVWGDPDALENYQVLPDVNVTDAATTATSAAVVATTTPMMTRTAAASKDSSGDSLDKVYKILQISLSVVAVCFIIGVSVWAAKRGEVVDWENGWAGVVLRVILRVRDGVAAMQERRQAQREIRDLVR